MISGSLLIDKKIGLTSRQEVNNVSHRLNEKKAGHIGTLDPFADGLLIVLLGSSTKISPFLETMDKVYIASLKLGEKTNTGDLTGEIIETKKVPLLTKEKVNEILSTFKGKQSQIPPMYSAIKVNGKELYKYARKGVEIERKSRDIYIHDITLLNIDNNIITFSCHVSKGTYIRTLAEDIALKLGSNGHLVKLTRVAIGPYSLKNAKKSDEVSEKDLIDIPTMLSHLKNIKLNESDAKKALNGCVLHIDANDEHVLVSDINGVIAIYNKQSNGVYSCLRGLRWGPFN